MYRRNYSSEPNPVSNLGASVQMTLLALEEVSHFIYLFIYFDLRSAVPVIQIELHNTLLTVCVPCHAVYPFRGLV